MSEHHEIAQAFRLAEISQQYTWTGSCPSQAFLGLGKEPLPHVLVLAGTRQSAMRNRSTTPSSLLFRSSHAE
jgi:hypothetical protein